MPIEIYSTNQPLPINPPVNEFFHGGLLFIQTHSILPACAILLALIITLSFFIKENSSRLCTFFALCLTSLLSVLVSVKVSEGWDELFINLRHSYVFAETEQFSCNIYTLQEATVDFIPFFFAGLLGKLSFPLIESIILLTLSGNVLIIIASWLIALRLTQDKRSALYFAAGIGLFPCVAFVGATGFTATFFTGIILFIFYFLFFSEENKKWPGLFLLSTLTLIRTEGILLTFLLWIYFYVFPFWGKNSDKKIRLCKIQHSICMGILLAAPFFISLIIRKLTFGYPIPNPITFKNAGGDPTYFNAGLQQLHFAVTNFNLMYFMIIGGLSYLFCLIKKHLDGKIFWCLAIIALFCFPYFTGGGDWFPIYWNRYMMPFTLMLVLFSWCALRLLTGAFTKNTFVLGLLSLGIVLLPFCEGMASKKLLAESTLNKNRWERIDALGFMGRYFKQTTPKDAVIASAEMATVMYFAQRDLLDLLGIANPEVAHSKLTPILPGDKMHRKRSPQTIQRHQPEIITFYGMIELTPSSQKMQNESNKEKTHRLTQQYINHYYSPIYQGRLNRMQIAYYRAGSLTSLEKMGYRQLIVSTPKAFINYLVHPSIYNTHIAALKKLGIQPIGNTTVNIPLHPEFTQQFLIK